MPPIRRVAATPIPAPPSPPPPSPPPPPRPPFPPLSPIEEELIDVAIHLDCALHKFRVQRGQVDHRFFTQCIVEELGDADRLSTSSPWVHPIIEHMGDLVIDASRNNIKLDLSRFSFEVVTSWCEEAAQNCPTETGIIHVPNLSTYLHRIPAENHWWVPDNTGMAPPPIPTSASTSTSVHTSSRSHGTVTYVEDSDGDGDIKMDELEGENTPRHKTRSASKKRAVVSPEVLGPDAQHPRIDDPDACGPCQKRQQKCVPLDPRTTALSCQHCTDHKIGCRPLAKWAHDLEAEGQDQDSLLAKTKQKGKGKWRNAAEAVDDLTPVMEGIRAEVATKIVALRRNFGNKLAELLTASSNHNAMLHSMCQQAGVNVASLRLRPPPAPLMEDYAASTPSASSVISNISSTSSNLPIGGLSIESPTTHSTASLPIAGPSGVNWDCASVIAPGEILRTGSGQGSTTSRPPSRAPSRALSTVGSRGGSCT